MCAVRSGVSWHRWTVLSWEISWIPVLGAAEQLGITLGCEILTVGRESGWCYTRDGEGTAEIQDSVLV